VQEQIVEAENEEDSSQDSFFENKNTRDVPLGLKNLDSEP
jgi:hypothetical protein